MGVVIFASKESSVLTTLQMIRFDSSRDRGSPLSSPIGVGRLIKGTCMQFWLHEMIYVDDP